MIINSVLKTTSCSTLGLEVEEDPKVFNVSSMFDIFFGWRKASRCKKLIKQLQCHLKLLKNKRSIVVKQLRDDVAELIKLGYEETAFNRAEQIFTDENTMAGYEILENYCEFLIINLPYIRRNKDCPNDINEAVSTLVYAAARCGELPELLAMRKLFGERYGQRFVDGAVESYPGNLVNREVKEKLSIKSVPDDVKFKLVEGIVEDYCLRPQVLAIEYPVELQQQYKEKIEDSPVQNSEIIEMDENSMDIEPDSMIKSSLTGPIQSQDLENSELISASVDSSIVHLSSPDVMESVVKIQDPFTEDSGFESEVGSPYETESQASDESSATNLNQKNKRLLFSVSSTESLPQFFGETVVYLDDVEEIQSSVTKEVSSQDQRLFKFKSLVSDFSDGSYVDHDNHNEGVASEKSGSRRSNYNNTDKKRPRRRSISQESSLMQDTDHEIYYDKVPSNKHKSNNRRKLQKNATEDEDGAPPWKQKRGDVNLRQFSGDNLSRSFTEMARTQVVQTAFPRGLRRRRYDNGDSLYVVFTWPNKEGVKVGGKHSLPFYLRAMTMPQERPKNAEKDRVVRFNSCNLEYPNHVHPKLPDCDEITAKFMALKKEYVQNKQ